MSWTPEQRRRYAPAIGEAVRANATVRLAATIDAIDPPARTGRPRRAATRAMLRAVWWLARAGAAWALLPSSCPPRQTIGSRLKRWVRLGVLDRALAVLNACLRLARGRTRRAWACARPRPGRPQRLPASRARAHPAALGRHPRHPERPDRAPGRPPRVRPRPKGRGPRAG